VRHPGVWARNHCPYAKNEKSSPRAPWRAICAGCAAGNNNKSIRAEEPAAVLPQPIVISLGDLASAFYGGTLPVGRGRMGMTLLGGSYQAYLRNYAKVAPTLTIGFMGQPPPINPELAQLLEDAEIDIPCPHCGEDLFLNVAQLRIDPRCRCSPCGYICLIDPEGLLNVLRRRE
jgi:hypothetical protein